MASGGGTQDGDGPKPSRLVMTREKECSVNVHVGDINKIKALDVIKAVVEACGDEAILSCVTKGADVYEVTLGDKESVNILLSGLKVAEEEFRCEEVVVSSVVVSFLSLPYYVKDEQIEDRLRSLGIELLGPIKRRYIKDTYKNVSVTDGARYVKVRFPNGMTSLPYTMKFSDGKSYNYYRVIHNHQSKVCNKCLADDHVFKNCPENKCFKCGKMGHLNRDCQTPMCAVCGKFGVHCVCPDKCPDCDCHVDECRCDGESMDSEDSSVKDDWCEDCSYPQMYCKCEFRCDYCSFYTNECVCAKEDSTNYDANSDGEDAIVSDSETDDRRLILDEKSGLLDEPLDLCTKSQSTPVVDSVISVTSSVGTPGEQSAEQQSTVHSSTEGNAGILVEGEVNRDQLSDLSEERRPSSVSDGNQAGDCSSSFTDTPMEESIVTDEEPAVHLKPGWMALGDRSSKSHRRSQSKADKTGETVNKRKSDEDIDKNVRRSKRLTNTSDVKFTPSKNRPVQDELD